MPIRSSIAVTSSASGSTLSRNASSILRERSCSEIRQLFEGVEVVGLNELRELLRSELHQCRDDLVVIPDPRAAQAIHKHLLVCQMVGISHYPDTYAFAGFVLELGRDLLANR